MRRRDDVASAWCTGVSPVLHLPVSTEAGGTPALHKLHHSGNTPHSVDCEPKSVRRHAGWQAGPSASATFPTTYHPATPAFDTRCLGDPEQYLCSCHFGNEITAALFYAAFRQLDFYSACNPPTSALNQIGARSCASHHSDFCPQPRPTSPTPLCRHPQSKPVPASLLCHLPQSFPVSAAQPCLYPQTTTAPAGTHCGPSNASQSQQTSIAGGK